MVTRIVKMQFVKGREDEFLQVFNDSKDKIRNFEGCLHLELLRYREDPTVFFTFSRWDSEEHLEKYRNSDLFVTTWAKTKVLFGARPEAWTAESWEVGR